MAGFLDTGIESDFSGLPNNHGVQTLDFIKKVLKGIRYASLSVVTRTVTGQVKNGDGSNHVAAVSVNIQCDQVLTVNIGTLVTTGNSSIQVTTNASGIFQVTVAGSQGATVMVTVDGGVTTTLLVGSGGTGGGGGGGGSTGVTLKDEGSTVAGGPHTTVNFAGSGVSVTDDGGGQATVTISGGGGGGGYQGKFLTSTWPGTTHPAGSIVRRGPFLYGTVNANSVDPCVVDGNLGSPTDWTPRGNAVQANNALRLINTTAQSSAGFSAVVHSGWTQKRLIIDAVIGPSGGADALQFGIYDSSLTTNPTLSGGLTGVTGFWGVAVDVWGNQFATISNGGGQANLVGFVTGSNLGGLEGSFETNIYHRYYLDMVESGANWVLTLYRFKYAQTSTGGTLQSDNPGYITSWTITKPTFTSWRFALGAWSGGVAGQMRVRNAWVENRNSGWDLLSMFPPMPSFENSQF